MPDGSVPADNPKLQGWAPEVWSIGHRNVQGAAINPATGRLWTVEHGAQRRRRDQHPAAGKNYGWPIITYGRDYSGAKIGDGTEQRRHRAAALLLGPLDRPLGHGILHRQPVPGLERQPVRRRPGRLRTSHRLVLDGERIVGRGEAAWPTSASASATSARAPTARYGADRRQQWPHLAHCPRELGPEPLAYEDCRRRREGLRTDRSLPRRAAPADPARASRQGSVVRKSYGSPSDSTPLLRHVAPQSDRPHPSAAALHMDARGVREAGRFPSASAMRPRALWCFGRVTNKYGARGELADETTARTSDGK